MDLFSQTFLTKNYDVISREYPQDRGKDDKLWIAALFLTCYVRGMGYYDISEGCV